mmetsp:Transcript_44373/g.105081  ORF Transcript_44373/g.105081 Transcript_44373/m.105081 type:complete len:252 (-) Transcript_44373:1872-2627(-)
MYTQWPLRRRVAAGLLTGQMLKAGLFAASLLQTGVSVEEFQPGGQLLSKAHPAGDSLRTGVAAALLQIAAGPQQTAVDSCGLHSQACEGPSGPCCPSWAGATVCAHQQRGSLGWFVGWTQLWPPKLPSEVSPLPSKSPRRFCGQRLRSVARPLVDSASQLAISLHATLEMPPRCGSTTHGIGPEALQPLQPLDSPSLRPCSGGLLQRGPGSQHHNRWTARLVALAKHQRQSSESGSIQRRPSAPGLPKLAS